MVPGRRASVLEPNSKDREKVQTLVFSSIIELLSSGLIPILRLRGRKQYEAARRLLFEGRTVVDVSGSFRAAESCIAFAAGDVPPAAREYLPVVVIDQSGWAALVVPDQHPCSGSVAAAEERHMYAELEALILLPEPARLYAVASRASPQRWAYAFSRTSRDALARALAVMEEHAGIVKLRADESPVDAARRVLGVYGEQGLPSALAQACEYLRKTGRRLSRITRGRPGGDVVPEHAPPHVRTAREGHARAAGHLRERAPGAHPADREGRGAGRGGCARRGGRAVQGGHAFCR